MHDQRPRHKEIKARNLRAGDLMRCGVSTNYVLIAKVIPLPGGNVDVRTDDGGKPSEFPWTMKGAARVALSTHGMTDAELEEAR